MTLTITDVDLHLLSGLEEAVVLGIILSGGVVRLRAADPSLLRGHVDWLRQEPMSGVGGGFSLIVNPHVA